MTFIRRSAQALLLFGVWFAPAFGVAWCLTGSTGWGIVVATLAALMLSDPAAIMEGRRSI